MAEGSAGTDNTLAPLSTFLPVANVDGGKSAVVLSMARCWSCRNTDADASSPTRFSEKIDDLGGTDVLHKRRPNFTQGRPPASSVGLPTTIGASMFSKQQYRVPVRWIFVRGDRMHGDRYR